MVADARQHTLSVRQRERTEHDVQGVGVVHWNPRRPVLRGRWGTAIPVRRRVRNFGDLLGPAVVRAQVRSRGLAGPVSVGGSVVAVGSILHFAEDGDVIWGAGINGKMLSDEYTFRSLDVRAVRGPRTRAFLHARGIPAPPVFGDPGLLVADAFPEILEWREKPEHDLTIVPNLNDWPKWRRRPAVISPVGRVEAILRRLARSRMIVASSLHALVVADALGIPNRGLVSQRENELKYVDYYEGTGRPDHRLATSVAEALHLGPEAPPRWRPDHLREAFPDDLWLGHEER